MAVSTARISQPIRASADDVAAWTEGGKQVVLLRGAALVEQDGVEFRASQIVLQSDAAGPGAKPTYHVQVYAEGNVRLENGAERQSVPSLAGELASGRPVMVLPPPRGREVVTQPQTTDQFYRRALTVFFTQTATANRIQLTATAAPAGNVPPTAGGAVAPPPVWPGEATPTQGPPTLQPPLFPTAPPADAQPLPEGVPPGLPALGPPLPPAAPPSGPPRNISIQPRTAAPFQFQSFTLPNGEKAHVAIGGVILNVRGSGPSAGIIDIEADRIVVWTKSDGDQFFKKAQTPEGQTAQDVEFYLSGNVQIRRAQGVNGQDRTTLQAEQVYYDVKRNVAVAVGADLEIATPRVPDPLHVKADELLQTGPVRYEAIKAQIFSSRLPSDPGLTLVTAHATVEDRTLEKKGLFGRTITDPKTGQPQTYVERLTHAEQVFVDVEGVPVFYLPVIQGDANDPLGPLQSLSFSQDRIFGTQFKSTFNVYNLLGINPIEGTRWSLDLDYLSRRGPAAGTDFEYGGKDLFDLPGKYSGLFKAYAIFDNAGDILGGGRGDHEDHPDFRDRVLFRHTQELPGDFLFQTQFSHLSDKNFLEQYYKPEFDTDVNKETYVYLKQQRDNWQWSGLLQPNMRDWVTETAWLPRADAALIGQSFLDLFTYNVRGSAGYAELHTTRLPPPPIALTDRRVDTGRFDVMQDLSLPFYLGPVKVVPYGVIDTAYYTDDLQNRGRDRFYGGGGVRASIPFSRLYPEVRSDLFNLDGIYHKVVFGGNYYVAHSDHPFTDYPQLDRLNEDATDQALRDVTPLQPFLNPSHGLALAASPVTSPIDNPQLYAIRRLVDNRADTLDSIEEVQLDLRQRWQTKRGYPGMEHVVDYVTLDLSASFFPNPNRDNFGSNVAFAEYDATWNVGDRTQLVSSGLVDPFPDGVRAFNVGAFLNRPDRTTFYVGYRFIDPIDQRALTGAVTYLFSPKYAMTAAATYDFGINQSMSNSLVFTRMGTDLSISVGFTYNALLNNFGFTLEVLPNLVAMRSGASRVSAFGAPQP
jgi:hypothetical protein